MMRITALTLLSVFIIGAVPAAPQNLQEIMQRFEAIENKLDRLEAAHKRDIAKLHQKTTGDVARNQDWSNFEQQLSSVSEQLSALRDEFHTLNYDWDRLVDVEAELEQLKVWREKWDAGGREYADLNLPNPFRPEGGVEAPEPPGAESIGLEISGFGDFLATIPEDNSEGNNFGFGQAEVDLETSFDEVIGVAAAICYEDEGFELGAFTVDFRLFGTEEDHVVPVEGVETSGIIAGQFDVPFGIDYNVYPSIDRKLVSPPLVVENTHDCWNDYGVQAYIGTQWFNGVVYGTNGFGYEGLETPGQEIGTKYAFGTRWGATPVELIEVGGSYAGFINENDEFDMALYGADLQFGMDGFSLKGEFIAHQLGSTGDYAVTNTGFYAQGMYDFGRFFIVSRYGMFIPDDDLGSDDLTRFSGGAGWVIRRSCELRFEYQANSGDDAENQSFLQLAVGF
jgi:flagellar biosynthesis chaperone FliJ